MNSDTLASNLVLIIPEGSLYHFGVMTSVMHMVWTNAVCGRLKSDYRYSKDVVYNNYPWPTPTDLQRQVVERCAQNVLDARASYEGATLGQMYSNMLIFPKLHQAHEALNKAVECCYRSKPFTADEDRLEYLFGLYEKLTK